MPNPYAKLLSPKRDRDSSVRDRVLVVESESDRSRIIFSAPFRRLQQKAQVFSLESNAAVRSRLTHSLEVAQIGRFLADQIVDELLNIRIVDLMQARAFVTFVETACLMHDLGNPPFGHFGEAAVSSWFEEYGLVYAADAMGEFTCEAGFEEQFRRTVTDFLEFDGNCQGLRIASLLQWKDDEFGLNLTYTSLASYLKYIREPVINPKEEKDKLFRKKAGFFQAEAPLVKRIWAHFGYDETKPQRFPLAYVMEAADDIAYCISDLEDSIEKELLNGKNVFSFLLDKWEAETAKYSFQNNSDAQLIRSLLLSASESERSSSATFTDFRTGFSRLLTLIAGRNYLSNHDAILDGTANSLIFGESPEGIALDVLKNYCREHVYDHPSVHRNELAGLAAIRGLLDHFGILLRCTEDRFIAALDGKTKDSNGKVILKERKMLALFPEKHIAAYRHALSEIRKQNCRPIESAFKEWGARAHLITDFVSGMTDDFALATFQVLSGIRVDAA